MKLRLQYNSVRLRLKQAEVAQLAEGGRLDENIYLGAKPGAIFTYSMAAHPEAAGLRAILKTNHLQIEAPPAMISAWARGTDVGMDTTVSVGDGHDLRVLVEKDFACLDGNEEENRDTFPNPLAGGKC